MNLVYPGHWRVAIRRTRLTPCASPMICFVGFFLRFGKLLCRHCAKEEEIQHNTKQNAPIREFSVKLEKQ